MGLLASVLDQIKDDKDHIPLAKTFLVFNRYIFLEYVNNDEKYLNYVFFSRKILFFHKSISATPYSGSYPVSISKE